MPDDNSPYYLDDGTQPEHWEPVEPDIPALRSRARELVGNAAELDPNEPIDVDPPRPRTMLELDRYDRIVSLGDPDPVRKRRPLRKPRYDHLTAIKWLDRFGCMTTEQLHRAVGRGATLRATQALLAQMHAAGLVERRRTQLAIGGGRVRGGSAPRVYSLTAAGYRLGQRSPGFYEPVIPRSGGRRRSEAESPLRLRHDLHAIGWWQAFNAALIRGVGVRDVLTPRYEEGVVRPPRVHTARGRGWRPVELRDILLGHDHDIAGIPSKPFDYVLQPDLTIQLEVFGELLGQDDDVCVDLLVEVDRTERPARNRAKFERYDAFLTGWGLLHPRVEELGTRPVVIFTSPDVRSMWALMKVADEVMTGRVGLVGEPAHAWYYPGRDHVLFTTEDEIHRGSMLAERLPKHPLAVRRGLCEDGFPSTTVAILPEELVAERAM